MHSQLANPAWSCGVRWGLQLSLLLFSWYRSPGESRLQRKAPSYGALTPCSSSHVAARSRSGVCVDKVSLRRWDTGWDLKGNEAISKASIEHVYGIWRWDKQCRALQLRGNKQTGNKRKLQKKYPNTSAVAFQIKSPLSLSQSPFSDVCMEIKVSFQPLHGLLVFRGPLEMKQQAHDFTAICFAWRWWRTSPPLTIQLPSDLFF